MVICVHDIIERDGSSSFVWPHACCAVLEGVAVCWGLLQYVAMCDVLQCINPRRSDIPGKMKRREKECVFFVRVRVSVNIHEFR